MTDPSNIPIPPGKVATVSIIDSTLQLTGLAVASVLSPPMNGFEEMPALPTWSFLVQSPGGKSILFDLGVPPDINTYAPATRDELKRTGWQIKAEKHVADILAEHGVDLSDIDAVIWR
jgi:hypothetical protein